MRRDAIDAASIGVKTRSCAAMLSYWLELRGEAAMPARRAIDPASMRSFLPHVMLLDLVNPDEIRVRLAGTYFQAATGFELTGTNVLSAMPSSERDDVAWRLFEVGILPCLLKASRPAIYGSGLQDQNEVLVCPLSVEPGQAPMLIIVASSVVDTKWQNMQSIPGLAPAESFEFVDVGYGVPMRRNGEAGWKERWFAARPG